MADDLRPTPATDAVKALAHFLFESESDDSPIDEVRTRLKNATIDVQKIRGRFLTDLAKARGRASLAQARQRREAFASGLAKLKARLTDVNMAREQVRGFLNEVFTGQPEAAIAWRNFEKATDEDLFSAVEDLTLLDQLTEQDDRSVPEA